MESEVRVTSLTTNGHSNGYDSHNINNNNDEYDGDRVNSLKVKKIRSRSKSPGRGGESGRDTSPGLGRTMRENISLDLTKWAGTDDVKWMVWLAETDVGRVGECQENYTPASFLSLLERVYGKSQTGRCMELLLNAVGKPEIADKVAMLRGGKKWRRSSQDRVTLTLKFDTIFPDVMRRSTDIENELRDLVEDDDNSVYVDGVSFGGGTLKIKMAASLKSRVETLLEDETLRRLDGVPILKYQWDAESIRSVATPRVQERFKGNDGQPVAVTMNYDKQKHPVEAQLLGVVLQQNGVKVLDPMVQRLVVWEAGVTTSFENEARDDVDVSYDLVCVDDVDDAGHVQSYNDDNVPVVLFSFDKENTETESSRLIYHLPWMMSLLLQKLNRRPPPPPKPIPETPNGSLFTAAPESSFEASADHTDGAINGNGDEDHPNGVVVSNDADFDADSLERVTPLSSTTKEFFSTSDGIDSESLILADEEIRVESDRRIDESVLENEAPPLKDDILFEGELDGRRDSIEEDVVLGRDAEEEEAALKASASKDAQRRESLTEEELEALASTLEDDSRDGETAAATTTTTSEDPSNAAIEVAEEMIQEDMKHTVHGGVATATVGTVTDDDANDVLNWTMHKVILIGDSSVGKTSILSRFSDHVFNSNFISTVGIDFKVKKIKRDKRKVKLQIWDTAGQERYRTITAAFYRGTSAFLVVFDVTQMSTFVNVRSWFNQISANTEMMGHVIVLIGNKGDLDELRQVPREAAQQFADDLGIRYFETSAKTGENVDELFHHVADVLPTEDEEEFFPQSSTGMKLNENPSAVPQSRCRC